MSRVRRENDAQHLRLARQRQLAAALTFVGFVVGLLLGLAL